MAAGKVELASSHLEEKISKCRKLDDHPTPIEYQNLKYFLPCIHRIPSGIRDLNPYSPSMVSIGLLHRGEKHLETMEDVKLRYMTRLLQRAQSDQWKKLQKHCLNALSRLEHFALEYYGATEIIHGEACDKDTTFLEMMLIDGCFIIELLIRFHLKDDDPILRNKIWSVAVSRDLLLLENQIPFFLLEELYKLTILECSNEDKVYPPLTKCIFSFFRDLITLEEGETGKEDQTREEENGTTVRHILHLLHKRYLPSDQVQVQMQQPTTYTQNKHTGTPSCNCILQIRNCTLQISRKNNSGAKETWEDFKYSATELDMSGVNLKPGNGKNLFDVKFSNPSCFRLCRRARFEIPPFCIYDNTEIFLRNTIAFEQSFVPKTHYYFTSHALLMDKLINSAADVKLLEEKGIIRNNWGGSREQVSTLFNNICKNISKDNFYFEEPCILVNKYCKRRRPKISCKTEK